MLLRTLMTTVIMAHGLFAYTLQGYHVMRTPEVKRRELFRLPDPASLPYDASKIYMSVELYNTINDGTNPTWAVMALSRYLYSHNFVNHPEQNVANSTTARKAIEYSTDNSIPLDCSNVCGSNRDLCLAALNTSIGTVKCFAETPTTIDDTFADMCPDYAEPYCDLDYLLHHVVKQPDEKRIWDYQDDICLINTTTETASYIKEYERINDGMNPTKAVVMRSRLFEIAVSKLEDKTIIGPAVAMQRNSVNDKGTAYGAEYIARFSIELDCDRMSGPDYEMCENMQKRPVLGLCFERNYTTDDYNTMIDEEYICYTKEGSIIGDSLETLAY